MKKEQLQGQELDQVSGGAIKVNYLYICPSCGAKHKLNDHYPNGFLLKEERRGCSSTVQYYKCPDCSHEWT